MRLWIVSDLHTDHSPWQPSLVPDHDVMVVAGDVAHGLFATLKVLEILQPRTGRPIVFVPGNHDVVGEDIDGFAKVRSDDRIHVLWSGQTVNLDGVRFVGATLWTNWQLGEREFQSQAWAARHMLEYQTVTQDGGPLWPIHTSYAHDRHRSAIETVLAQPHDGSTVVVTHHAPSPRSLRPGEIRSIEAAAYASDLEPVMVEFGPALWVHGHTHHAVDYEIGHTRVVSNPRGYQGDWPEETGWQEGLVIEV